MPLTRVERTRLAALNLPGDAVVHQRLDRWMAQSGWNDADIADAITKADGTNYSRSSVNLYKLGRYPGGENDSRAMRAALIGLMERHPTALERSVQGKTYQTESHRKVRRAFFKALDLGWAYCVDGAPGTQKTHSLLALCAELESMEAEKNGNARRVVYVRCRPLMSRRDLLAEMCLGSGVAPRGYIGQMLRKVRHFFAARRVLLILDEGQHLDNDALETVRELLDEPPISV